MFWSHISFSAWGNISFSIFQVNGFSMSDMRDTRDFPPGYSNPMEIVG